MVYNINDTEAKSYIDLVRRALSDKEHYIYIATFGCQQNEADSEKILGLAESMGYSYTDDPERADLVIFNTCAIREHAEEKALSMLGRFKALRKKKPELIVGVVGCMAAEPHRAEMLKRDFHYVSFTLEPNMIHRLPELVAKKLIDNKRSFIFGEDKGDIYEGTEISRRSGHRAWVSIMYGCNNFCSYCIVPYVRGRERSRNSVDIIEECKNLVASGVKEITLLGQNVNSYKSDIAFPELLRRIALIEGDFLISFMTSHPKDTSDELIDVMAEFSPKIAPYFHLPLQSGSTRILKLMNRTYTKEQFLQIAEKLRGRIPNIALSTDVIIGFPSETDEDFVETLDVLSAVRFDMVYSFLYSPRVGTVASRMDDAIARDVKDKRMAELLKLQDSISLEKNLPYKGKTVRVLVDSSEERGGEMIYTGRTDTNKLVHFKGENIKIGDFVFVEIEKIQPFDLIGKKKEGK